MDTFNYPIPNGVHEIPLADLDSGSDEEIDQALLNPPPVNGIKNVWFFWHAGFAKMHPYTQRNVRSWHRRLSKHGWTIRVLNRAPGSPLNVSEFFDVHDPAWFPKAFVDGRIGGDFAPQHTSDLVRWPLLLKYGGVYADAGMLQIGDLNELFEKTVGDPSSKYEVLSYVDPTDDAPGLYNYFLCSGPNNALFQRCHKLFLAFWNENGGRTDTEGAHKSRLLRAAKHMSCPAFEYDGRHYSAEEAGTMLTDYIAQGAVITSVLGLVDEGDNWDGPKYMAENVYGVDFATGSQLINEMTQWDGKRQFELMSLPLPKDGEKETDDQKAARDIVETCLSKSFGFKLAHGMIIKVYKYTLGSLWRDNEGSDDVPGTYGHWLRYGISRWCQDELPPPVQPPAFKPTRVGPLID